MSRMCPKCKREIDENVKFCPFCAAFTGEKEETKKKNHIGAIIGGIAGAVVLGGAAVAVFAFDVFGLFNNEPEILYGTGDKLFNLSLSPAKSGDKWGYIGKDGKFRIEPQFDCAYPFDENANGTAAVSNGSGYGFINDRGKFTVEPQFALASFYSDNGLSVVTAGDGYMLYVDGSGRTAYNEKHFTYAEPFDSGAAYTFAYTTMTQSVKNDKGEDVNDVTDEYYLLKNDGKTVTALPDGIGADCVFGEYYVGFASDTEINEGSNDFTKKDYAVFTADGEQKSEWHDRIFVTDEFVVMCDTDYETNIYKAEVYDINLNKVSDEYYCDRNQKFTDSGLVLIKIEDKRYRKVLVILKDGKLDEVYKESDGTAVISGFDNSGIACIYDKGKYCGYTADGKAFECDYPFTSFNCGLAPFYDNKNGKIGYINTNGEAVITARYDGVSEFYADGYAYVYENGGYGIIDISGQTVAENLSLAPTKLINNSVNHNWYTPKCFDGAEYYENAVNYGTIKVRIPTDFITWIDENGNPVADSQSYNTSLIRLSDGKEVLENSNLIQDFRASADGYALIRKDGYYLLDGKGNLTLLTDKKTDDILTLKYGDEQFYGFFDGGTGTLSMRDVNNNTFNITFGGNVTVKDYLGAFAFTESKGENSLRNRYKVYLDNLSRPFVTYTNHNVDITNARNNIIEMTVQYYGSIDNHNDVQRIIDGTTGECLLSGRTDSGYLYTLNDYFAEAESAETTGYIDVTGDVIYRENSEITYYTIGGKKIGSFITAFAYDDKLLAVCDDGKYKLFSRYGELLGEYDYACMSEQSQYIVIKKGDKYVCLDRRMNEVFESEYPFNPPVNNYAAYADLTNGKIGYLDMNGEVAIPAFTDFASDFSADGYVRTADSIQDSHLGKATEKLIDTSGKTVYDNNKFAVDINGFGYSGEYFKTIYSFADGYKYIIDYCKKHKDELRGSENKGNITVACKLEYGDCTHDSAGNMPYQFIPMMKKVAYGEGVSILYDGTPVLPVYIARILSGERYGLISEARFYGLDGKEINIKYHGTFSDDETDYDAGLFVNGYIYEKAKDDYGDGNTIYVYDANGKDILSVHSPEDYHYYSISENNLYIFAYRNYTGNNSDGDYTDSVDVFTPDGKALVSCDNVIFESAGFLTDNKDEIRFTCYKGTDMKEDRIYSLSQGKFVRTENEEILQ